MNNSELEKVESYLRTKFNNPKVVVEGREKTMKKTDHENKHGVRDAHSTTPKKENTTHQLIQPSRVI